MYSPDFSICGLFLFRASTLDLFLDALNAAMRDLLPDVPVSDFVSTSGLCSTSTSVFGTLSPLGLSPPIVGVYLKAQRRSSSLCGLSCRGQVTCFLVGNVSALGPCVSQESGKPFITGLRAF